MKYAVTREYYNTNGQWMCPPDDAYDFKIGGLRKSDLSKVARFLRDMDKERSKCAPSVYKDVGYIDYEYRQDSYWEDDTIGCYGHSLKVNGIKR